jgi:hypothetical protein
MDRLPQGWVVGSITQVTPRPSIRTYSESMSSAMKSRMISPSRARAAAGHAALEWCSSVTWTLENPTDAGPAGTSTSCSLTAPTKLVGLQVVGQTEISQRNHRRAVRFFWCFLIGATLVSLVGNVAHAILRYIPPVVIQIGAAAIAGKCAPCELAE